VRVVLRGSDGHAVLRLEQFSSDGVIASGAGDEIVRLGAAARPTFLCAQDVLDLVAATRWDAEVATEVGVPS
jgi:hypothetical protein